MAIQITSISPLPAPIHLSIMYQSSVRFPPLLRFFPTVCSSEIHFADWGEFVAELNRMIGGENVCQADLAESIPLSPFLAPWQNWLGFFSTGLTSGRKEDDGGGRENPTDEEPEALPPPPPPPTTSRGPMGVKPHHPMIKAEGETGERGREES